MDVSRHRRAPLRLPVLAVAVLGLVGVLGSNLVAAHPDLAAAVTPPVRHVYVIVLENEGYAATFENPGADPYLASTLPSEGALLTEYYAIGHESNDNYIAMVSGQAPNPQTQADCQVYSDFVSAGVTLPPGQAVGTGCVYPRSILTIANQLDAAGVSWKGYMQDMGNDPGREAPTCGHPALGSSDNTQTAVAGDGYATRHDPFVYFHAVIDNAAYCSAHVVALGRAPAAAEPATSATAPTSGTATAPATAPAPAPTSGTAPASGLAEDLRSVRTTPNLSFIVPNLCEDGHDYPCTNEPSPTSSALGDIDSFLETWVPVIVHSPAFRHDGLLAVVFDEADGPPTGDSSVCCGEVPGPDSPLPGVTGPGGGRTGALLLSPFIRPGTTSATTYDHYSLLASIEDIFGLARLGEAQNVPATFGTDVFTAVPTHRTGAGPS